MARLGLLSFSLVIFKFQPYPIFQIAIGRVPITIKKKYLLELREFFFFSSSSLVFGQVLV